MKTLTLSYHLSERFSLITPELSTLTCEGVDSELLFSLPRVAIVGSRKATPYGIRVTENLASELAKQGVVIVSGLAYGIDITAHKATLSVGGRTIAVLPSGISRIYPVAHTKIAQKISESGMLVSEYPAEHHPRKIEFLERNRLIAGLSDLVVVTEAAEHSGSLNTVQHAMKMNIPVAAVPGPITSLYSAGTNALIKEGAHLITSAQDILALLNIDTQSTLTKTREVSDPEILALIDLLARTPLETTAIALELGIDTKKLLNHLTMLELSGDVEQNAIGIWQLR